MLFDCCLDTISVFGNRFIHFTNVIFNCEIFAFSRWDMENEAETVKTRMEFKIG